MEAPSYTLRELADLLEARLVGDPGFKVRCLRDMEWLSADNPVQAQALYFVASAKALARRPRVKQADCVLTTAALAEAFPHALVVEENALRITFAALLRRFKQDVSPPEPGAPPISPSASIGPGCQIYPGAVVMDHARVGAGCRLLPGCVIESHARIGDRTTVHANAVVGHHCRIGSDGIIHANAVLGADGFGFHDQDGHRYKLDQIGNVELGDQVEVGAGCTIDRATIESTRIGDGTKFDNQVHIAHNCQIGRHVLIAACTGVSGSTVIEDRVIIGGMCALSDHIRVVSGAVISSMSGVLQDVKTPGVYFGIPVRPARQMHKIHAALAYLPELVRSRRHAAHPPSGS